MLVLVICCHYLFHLVYLEKCSPALGSAALYLQVKEGLARRSEGGKSTILPVGQGGIYCFLAFIKHLSVDRTLQDPLHDAVTTPSPGVNG